MSEFRTHDGLRLDYSDEGSGVPVLCLPGLTRNRHDFEFVIKAMQGEARFIALTLRGRGGSDFDPNWRNYNLMVEMQDVLAFLDFLGLEKVLLLGTSRGGLIAHLMAAGAKERLAGVILNDIGPVLERGGLDNIADYLGRAPVFRTLEEAAAGLAALWHGFDNIPAARWQRQAEILYAPGKKRLSINYDPKMRDAVLESLQGESADLWPLFDEFAGLPLALIRGMNSNLLSAATAQEMQQRHPGMIRAEVPDRGHVPFLDEPECLAAIRAVLAQVQQ